MSKKEKKMSEKPKIPKIGRLIREESDDEDGSGSIEIMRSVDIPVQDHCELPRGI